MDLNKTKTELRVSDVSSGQKLQGRNYILEQKHDTLECLFCCFCQGANEYTVFQSDPNYNVSNKTGYIKQSSDCLSRLFCVCNRPFEAKLRVFSEEIATAERECGCWLEYIPCKENEVRVVSKTGRLLGILRVGCWCLAGTHFACADSIIQVLNGEDETVLYTIEGNYCQKSIQCPCFRCCYCPNVDYIIFDSLTRKVGKISNIYNGCCAELFTRADKFGVQFPAHSSEEHKILLMFSVMYLDYLRYETPYFCLGIR